MKHIKLLLLIAATIILTACGGGGSSNPGTDAPPANKLPVVNAGQDLSVQENTPVTITGTASDSDGTIASTIWSINGQTKSASSSFVYTPTTVGVDTLTLTVTDNDGATVTDTMKVTVTATPKILVSNGILKTLFLPKQGLNGVLTFSIDNTGTKGIVKVLDATTGRYSFLPDDKSSSDSFFYTVTDVNGNSVTKRINANIELLPVIMNVENHTITHSFSSNLPIVVVDTGGITIPDDPKVKGSMSIIMPTDNGHSHIGLPTSYAGHIEIEVRGSSSKSFPKKQYSFDTETWDAQDDDVSLLGMPAEHKWILHAPYSDKSLMRNYLAYNKTRQLDESKYNAVRTKYVEVLTRIEDYYRYDGVYIVMEKIKRDKNRVDIKKMKSSYDSLPKLSGGYIFKRDRGTEGILGIDGTKYVFVYPKEDKVTGEQSTYLENYMQSFEIALNEDDYGDANSTNYYGNYIDIDSFIIHMLSREFFRDVDTWALSEYLHKERDEKLSMGAVWDFNLGMGNNNYGIGSTGDSTTGWSYNRSSRGLYHWMSRLMGDPTFRGKAKQKWKIFRSTIWSDQNLTLFIDETKLLLDEAAIRNFSRWTNILGHYVWPNAKNCTDHGAAIYCDTYEGAVNESLKTWILNRVHWIDGNI